MPRLRQLPRLYLRGALANQTMRGLTPQQRAESERYTREIFADFRSRPSFVKALAGTIGGDYKEDPAAADQDMLIAIWKGVVQVLYHHRYTYWCTHCQATEYRTKEGKVRPIDRDSHAYCPACKHVEIYDPGSSGLEAGTFVHADDLDGYIRACLHNQGAPCKARGPIRPVPHDRRYNDAKARAILDDPEQRHKFFSLVVWNQLRQILKENEIKTQTFDVEESHPADLMAVHEILSALTRHRVKHQYAEQAEPADGYYTVHCSPLSSTPDFTADFADLIDRYAGHGVPIEYSNHWIRVPVVAAAPTINGSVVHTTPVLVNTAHHSIKKGGEDSQYTVEHLEYRVIDGTKRSQESQVNVLERNEVLASIRYGLADDVRKAFDILTEGQFTPEGETDTWAEFSARYEVDGFKAKNKQIADFLGVNPKVVESYRSCIGVHMLAHQLGVDHRPGDESYDD